MKTILFFLFTIIVINVSGQATRIRNLVNQPTYDSNLYFAVDRSTFATHRKILASTLTDYINGLSLTRDTAIWNRLDTLENNELFVAGGGDASVQLANTNDTALADYSFAHGYNSKAYLIGSRAYSSGNGKSIDALGWSQNIEYTVSGESPLNSYDTLLIANITPIDIQNKYTYHFTLTVIGVENKSGFAESGVFVFKMKQISGTTTISAIDTVAYNKDGGGLVSSIVISADDTTERLIIKVGGNSNDKMYWHGKMDVQMIKFD